MMLSLAIVVAYLLGSLSGSLIAGRLRGGIDIRTQGSGNAGGTNALRTQGLRFAMFVVAFDVGKSWLATAVVPAIAWQAGASPGAYDAVLCALAAMVGHVWPIWHGFRGGKGVATVIGSLLALSPVLFVIAFAVWIALVVALGFVGLASIVATAAVPIAALLGAAAPQAPLIVFGLAATALVVFTHRGNLARMRAGTEPRARRLWLFGRNAGR